MTEDLREPGSVLDNFLCAAVYRAAHAFTAAYRTQLEPYGLTYPQYLVLVALWERQPRTVSELGDLTDLDSGTLSPLLRRLERAGWIQRTRSTSDARVVQISLTERGRDLRLELAAVPEHVGRCVGITSPDAADLLTGLRQLTSNLRTAG